MKIKIRTAVAAIAIALALLLALSAVTACGEGTDPDDYTGRATEGWSDSWGADDWGDGYKPPSSDPDDYNKIDWSEKYASYESGIRATRAGEFIPFYPGNGAHIYEAENALLAGSANTTEDETYVGNLDNSSVTFTIESEAECDVLIVAAMAVNPDFTGGLPFTQQYSLSCNGTLVDVSDCWLFGTGSWSEFKDNAVGEATLVAGENKIEFFSGLSRSNIDCIKLVPTKADAEKYPPAPEKYENAFDINDRIEAESTDFTNARTENSSNNTGTNISWTSDDTTIEFVATNGLDVGVTRTLHMYAAVGDGDDTSGPLSHNMAERLTLSANGEEVTLGGEIPYTDGMSSWYNTYMDITIAELTFAAGSRTTIRMTLSDQINIDYFEFVGDPVLTGLAVSGQKTIYGIGDSVSKDDLTVAAVYDHGENKTLTGDDFEVSHDPFDAATDSAEVTVSYTEGEITRTTTYSVRVTDETYEGPTRITVSDPVCKTEYLEGDTFSLTSVTVNGEYSDGNRPLDSGDYTLSYSLSDSDGWTDTLVLPTLDPRQNMQSEVTVYIRAVYAGDPSLASVVSVPVTVYDTVRYELMETYVAYDEADVCGMVNGSFVPYLPANGVHRYEAENAVTDASINSGGYVGDLREGKTVTFNINSAAGTNQTVLLVASLAINPNYHPTGGDGAYFPYTELVGGDGSVNKVTVNGTDAEMTGMVCDTNSWTAFADSAIGEVTLRPGANEIVMTFYADATNLAYIKLVPKIADAAGEPDPSLYAATVGADGKIEAEDTYFTGARIENDKNLAYTNTDTLIRFTFDNETGGAVTRTLRMYAAVNVNDSKSAAKSERITLKTGGSDVALTGELPSPSGSTLWYNEYKNVDIAEITLDPGATVIEITLSEEINVDYFELVEVSA